MKHYQAILLTVVMGLITVANACAGNIEDALAKAKKAKMPVFLEVGATTCIPCKKMQPIMKQIEGDYKGKIIVLFLDVKRERDQSLRLGVLNIPTQIFYDKSGKEIHRHLGFYPYEEIKPILKKLGL